MEEALERFALAQEAEAENRREMLEDLRFAALEQWPEKLKRMRELDINGARPCLVLDKIGQYRRQVINDTRQNLPSIRFRPVDDRSDKDTAEVLNGLARHVQDVSSADIAHLTALDWAVTCGLGYFRILTEYTSDDSWDQDIRIARIHNPFAVYFDPHSTAPDGSDAEWCFITEDVPKKAFERLHPKAELGGDLGPASEGDLVHSWFSEESIRVAEYFRIERVKDEVVLLEDQSSLYGSEYRKRLEGGEVLIPVVRARRVDRRLCQWEKITGREPLEEREFPSSYIPVIPVIGTEFWIEGKRQLSGMVRPGKDPQRALNYWASVATEVTALQPRAPFIGAAGQFEGFEKEWETANTENHAFLPYNPEGSGGALSPPPQRQPFPGAPTGMLQLMQMFEGHIQSALGMYNASVGAPSNEKSGIAIRERKNEGDVGTAHYRGNLALSERHEGRILLEMFGRIYDTARIARIIGEDGAVETVMLDPRLPAASQKTPRGQPNLHNITLGRYDVSVDIGPAYATKRQDAAAGDRTRARRERAARRGRVNDYCDRDPREQGVDRRGRFARDHRDHYHGQRQLLCCRVQCGRRVFRDSRHR
jgi:portal protein